MSLEAKKLESNVNSVVLNMNYCVLCKLYRKLRVIDICYLIDWLYMLANCGVLVLVSYYLLITRVVSAFEFDLIGLHQELCNCSFSRCSYFF